MFETYRQKMNMLGTYEGEARRNGAQKIMDVSWRRDAATRPVYVKWVNKGLPTIEDNDEVLYAKFNNKAYYSISGDEVEYLLQFRLDDIKQNPNIKVGSYVSIENEAGVREWWILAHFDDRPQFRQYTILKCLHVYRWVTYKDGYRILHECLGVPRTQNSYNSGVWLDYKFQVVENQSIMILPTNEDSDSIGYDTRFLISNSHRYPPITWQISKIQPKINGDITYFTMTQEQFNPDKDNAELMLANYYQSAVEPTQEIVDSNDIAIVYTGMPSVTAGGSYKKLTLKQLNREDNDLGENIKWIIESDEFDVSNIELVRNHEILKLKCANDYTLIGKKFKVIAECKYGIETLIMEVVSL